MVFFFAIEVLFQGRHIPRLRGSKIERNLLKSTKLPIVCDGFILLIVRCDFSLVKHTAG